ncbi:hypothetical protein ADUPG1_012681 [Aduncisulcus paluster]|uniref:Uncharacterized protein n=1 Tax=Aduncisulcus paluster TaxID=2918883 RepID=A0ABQ5K2C3_9EUKA|nr:hypothetical protein ADUPG1_012681 [Aduncisulcus paluster]
MEANPNNSTEVRINTSSGSIDDVDDRDDVLSIAATVGSDICPNPEDFDRVVCTTEELKCLIQMGAEAHKYLMELSVSRRKTEEFMDESIKKEYSLFKDKNKSSSELPMTHYELEDITSPIQHEGKISEENVTEPVDNEKDEAGEKSLPSGSEEVKTLKETEDLDLEEKITISPSNKAFFTMLSSFDTYLPLLLSSVKLQYESLSSILQNAMTVRALQHQYSVMGQFGHAWMSGVEEEEEEETENEGKLACSEAVAADLIQRQKSEEKPRESTLDVRRVSASSRSSGLSDAKEEDEYKNDEDKTSGHTEDVSLSTNVDATVSSSTLSGKPNSRQILTREALKEAEHDLLMQQTEIASRARCLSVGEEESEGDEESTVTSVTANHGEEEEEEEEENHETGTLPLSSVYTAKTDINTLMPSARRRKSPRRKREIQEVKAGELTTKDLDNSEDEDEESTSSSFRHFQQTQRLQTQSESLQRQVTELQDLVEEITVENNTLRDRGRKLEVEYGQRMRVAEVNASNLLRVHKEMEDELSAMKKEREDSLKSAIDGSVVAELYSAKVDQIKRECVREKRRRIELEEIVSKYMSENPKLRKMYLMDDGTPIDLEKTSTSHYGSHVTSKSIQRLKKETNFTKIKSLASSLSSMQRELDNVARQNVILKEKTKEARGREEDAVRRLRDLRSVIERENSMKIRHAVEEEESRRRDAEGKFESEKREFTLEKIRLKKEIARLSREIDRRK